MRSIIDYVVIFISLIIRVGGIVLMKSIKITTRIRSKEVNLIYNLVFNNALYSLECYKEDGNQHNPSDYCLLSGFTDDEGEAEVFLQKMTKGEVLPIHMNDMYEDCFFR
jgi:hypothetical protein